MPRTPPAYCATTEVEGATVALTGRDRRGVGRPARGGRWRRPGRPDGLVRAHRRLHRRQLRADVHRQRAARCPRAAVGAGIRAGHRPGAVRVGRVLRPAPGRGAATRQHPDLVDARILRRWRGVLGLERGDHRLAPVDRPAHGRGHHHRALEGVQRPHYAAHLPGADRPRPAQHRDRDAADHATVVGDGHGHRRDRRHACRPQLRGHQGLGPGRSAGLGRGSGAGDRNPRQRSPASCTPAPTSTPTRSRRRTSTSRRRRASASGCRSR